MTTKTITKIEYTNEDTYQAAANGEEWMGYTIQLRTSSASLAAPVSQAPLAAPVSQAPLAPRTSSASQAPLKPIGVYINLYRQCCEQYDVLFLAPSGMMEADFLGAEVRRVGWGRKLREEYASCEGFPFDPRDTPHAVVEIDTNRGLIQLVPYNDHNGYYPHDIKVQWENYEDIQRL